MTEKEIRMKAVKLCEGQTVWVGSHMVRAKRIPPEFLACNECEMDSICDYDMQLVCAVCDAYDGHPHILYLHPKSSLKK